MMERFKPPSSYLNNKPSERGNTSINDVRDHYSLATETLSEVMRQIYFKFVHLRCQDIPAQFCHIHY